jgi:hypothetical protein
MPLRLWRNDDVALFSPHPNGRAPTPWAVEKATEFLVTYTVVFPPVPQALPLAPFMTVTITSLSPHPSVNISANIAEVGNSGSPLDPGRADHGRPTSATRSLAIEYAFRGIGGSGQNAGH